MDGERPEAIIGRPSVWRLGSPVDERRGPRHLGDLMDGGPLRDLDEEPLTARYRAHMVAAQP